MTDNDSIIAKLREELHEFAEEVCDPESSLAAHGYKEFAHGYIMALQRAINLLENDR